jgi:hypothetical protein
LDYPKFVIVVAFLLVAQLLLQWRYAAEGKTRTQIGRYAALGAERVLDTQTGKVYAPYEGKVVVLDLVEMSRNQVK